MAELPRTGEAPHALRDFFVGGFFEQFVDERLIRLAVPRSETPKPGEEARTTP